MCAVCAGGELFDRIKEQPDGNYSENDAADVLRQICEGLKYMHEHKIGTETKASTARAAECSLERRAGSERALMLLSPLSPFLSLPPPFLALFFFSLAHCDLKPDNFLFSSREKNSSLKIIDFGAATHTPCAAAGGEPRPVTAHCAVSVSLTFAVPSRVSVVFPSLFHAGMSKWVKRRKYFKSLRGTPYYIAPEVIQGRYTEHCDMWSVGQ